MRAFGTDIRPEDDVTISRLRAPMGQSVAIGLDDVIMLVNQHVWGMIDASHARGDDDWLDVPRLATGWDSGGWAVTTEAQYLRIWARNHQYEGGWGWSVVYALPVLPWVSTPAPALAPAPAPAPATISDAEIVVKLNAALAQLSADGLEINPSFDGLRVTTKGIRANPHNKRGAAMLERRARELSRLDGDALLDEIADIFGLLAEIDEQLS